MIPRSKRYRAVTKRQREVLHFIAGYINEHGISPTTREVNDGIGTTSSSTGHLHIQSLAIHGLIEHQPHRPRSIRITDKGWLMVNHERHDVCPTCGRPVGNGPITVPTT